MKNVVFVLIVSFALSFASLCCSEEITETSIIEFMSAVDMATENSDFVFLEEILSDSVRIEFITISPSDKKVYISSKVKYIDLLKKANAANEYYRYDRDLVGIKIISPTKAIVTSCVHENVKRNRKSYSWDTSEIVTVEHINGRFVVTSMIGARDIGASQ